MEFNPYAASPETAVPRNETPAASAEAPFFAVSLGKLTVMSLVTLGMYEFYWFYRNWRLIGAHEGRHGRVVPVLKTFFSVLFCYSCFRRIRGYGESKGIAGSPPAGKAALGWIALTLTERLPDPYWLVALFSCVFIFPIQVYANRINAALAPDHPRNDRLSGLNWVMVVIGGVFLLLVVLGVLGSEFGLIEE